MMNYAMNVAPGERFAPGLSPTALLEASDVLEALTSGLGPAWVVSCERDYDRQVSIVVLPADFDAALSFLVYQDGNEIVVATLLDDEWTRAERVATFSQAAALLIKKQKSWTGNVHAGDERSFMSSELINGFS